MFTCVRAVTTTGALGTSISTTSNLAEDDLIALIVGVTVDASPEADTRISDADVYEVPMLAMPTLMVVADPESPSPG